VGWLAYKLVKRYLANNAATSAPEAPPGDMVQCAVRVARQQGMAKEGERLVVTAGVPFGTPGATNILRIAWIR
jgi:pyruvate kinase